MQSTSIHRGFYKIFLYAKLKLNMKQKKYFNQFVILNSRINLIVVFFWDFYSRELLFEISQKISPRFSRHFFFL